MLTILHKFTSQTKLHNFATNNVFNKVTTQQQQNKKSNKKTLAEARN